MPCVQYCECSMHGRGWALGFGKAKLSKMSPVCKEAVLYCRGLRNHDTVLRITLL